MKDLDKLKSKIEYILNTNKTANERIEGLKALEGFEVYYKYGENNNYYRILYNVPNSNFKMWIDVPTDILENKFKRIKL